MGRDWRPLIWFKNDLRMIRTYPLSQTDGLLYMMMACWWFGLEGVCRRRRVGRMRSFEFMVAKF